MIQARQQASISVLGLSTFLAPNNAPVLFVITAPLFGLAFLTRQLDTVRQKGITLAQEPYKPPSR
jgi:hypothetical protein